MSGLTIGSLFSGIGGLELGLERGIGQAETLWQVERDPSCRHWLAEHWPDAMRYDDVCAVGASNLTPVDLICGGFPCQPHSVAGLRKGSEDERDLWGEFARIIRELRPRYVVGENVPGLLTSDDGWFFNRVLSDLAALGFDVEWDVLSAADVSAPHLRERLFIIARRREVGHASRPAIERHARTIPRAQAGIASSGPYPRRVVDGHADAGRVVGHSLGERGGRERSDAGNAHASSEVVGAWADTVPVRGYDGTVRLIPRDAATTGPESPLWPVAHGVPGRVARLRAIGNAVVPQVAEVVGRLIAAMESERLERAA